MCFILCNKNFPANRPLAISLTVSFNGVSAALYTLAANAIDPSSDAIYLLLNSLIPLLTSIASLIPILSQPTFDPLPPEAVRRDSLIFLFLNFLAVITGVYLLLFGSTTSDSTVARLLFSGAICLLIFPICIPGVVYAKQWIHDTIHSSFRLEGSGFILVDADDLELHKELLSRHASSIGPPIGNGSVTRLLCDNEISMHGITSQKAGEVQGCCGRLIVKDQLALLGEEHPAQILVRRFDFWLYYLAYFCGGTIGLVYSNNLGQIAQSLGQGSNTTTLLTLYSSFSFFGRLLSAVPDYIRA